MGKNRLVIAIILILLLFTVGSVVFLEFYSIESLTFRDVPVTADQEIVDDTVASTNSLMDSELFWYENSTLGFSMQIPKVGPNNEPVEVIDMASESGVIIQYKRESDGTMLSWNIYVRTVLNEDQLTNFLDEHYGKVFTSGTCRIDSFPPTLHRDTFNIILSGPGVYDGDSSCGRGSITYMKYSPNFQKVALWDAGQDEIFYREISATETNSYEKLMADSFHFKSF